jgi:hypothetical protein
MKSVVFGLIFSIAALFGCAAKPTIQDAHLVEVTNEAPNKAKCTYLGEVIGSQGNWFTGDYTSNENLVIGARNELRNKTHSVGGNVVHIQDMKNTNAYGSLGTTNTTAVGKAYRCIP